MRIDPLGKFPCQMGVSACVLITSAALTVVLLTQLGPICERDRVCVCAGCEQKAAEPRSLAYNTERRRSGCSKNLCARLNKLTFNFSCARCERVGSAGAEKCARCCASHYRCFQLLFAESRSRFPLCMLDFHYLSLSVSSVDALRLPWVICIVKSCVSAPGATFSLSASRARAGARPAPWHRC